MLKKLLSVLLSIGLVFAVAGSAFAAASSFTDVPSPAYDWAIPDIEAMTRDGIIKGYSDQTFKPANAIKKIEMLLLLARAAQFQNDDYAPFVDFATDLYSAVMSRYNLGDTYNKYKPEVSFLLYKGIISIDELDNLIGGGQANMAVKRYEAAVLLTKLMGAEEQVRNNIAPVLSYSDFASIPAAARAYVEYVTSQGIMGGIGNNNFGPNDNVTRAQIAVILRRVLSKLNYSIRVGTVKAIDPVGGTITISDNMNEGEVVLPVNFQSAKVILDGYPSTAYGIAVNSYVLLLYSGQNVTSVEVLNSLNDMSIVNCTLVNMVADDEGDYVTLTVRDRVDASVSEFTVYNDALPQIFSDGKACELGDLRAGQQLMVTLADDKVVSISAKTDTTGISGVITNIEIDPDYVISVLLSDESLTDFVVSGTVAVVRNGSTVSLRDLLVGDSVLITETDGVVSSITATSSQSEATGVLYSILISSSPKLGVRAGGENTVYPVAINAEYEVDGGEATIYDLRLGSTVELGLEGSSIVRVIASSEASNHQAQGLILDYNLSYGYMTVENADGATEQVFLAMDGASVSTSIIDGTTGERISATDLDAGLRVMAVGTYSNGSFIASTVVVLPN